VTFSVEKRKLETSPSTTYVRGSCEKLKKGKHVTTVALPQSDGVLSALEVTFDADLLQ
jgi:hypothetical protein